MARKPYPSDVTDDEWMFVAPYLTLMREDAPQREHDLRDVFNALRWIVRAGSPWRYMANDLPPWEVVYQQTQRWIRAGVFEGMVHDLRELLRMVQGRPPDPSAAIIDSRTLQSTPESGHRAGYDGAKRKKGSKVHMAVDTLGHLLALHVTPADKQDRAEVKRVAKDVQKATGKSVELAFVDQGYTGQTGLCAAASAMGWRAIIRVDGSVPTTRQRLRTAACDGSGTALHRFRVPDADEPDARIWRKCITRSRARTIGI
jgi:transposase